MKKQLSVLCLILMFFLKSFSQDFSKSAVFVGGGLGISHNAVTDGFGSNWSVGYQRDIWKNRLRVVPSFNIGTYSAGAEDAPDGYFSSKGLKLNLSCDVLKIKAFSLLLGVGVMAKYVSGVVGPGTFGYGRSSTTYFNNFNTGIGGLMGFRFTPLKSRIGVEFILFDGALATKHYFSEVSVLDTRIIVRLK